MAMLIPASKSNKKTLRVMLDIYLLELSQYQDIDLDYPYLDSYWQEDQARWPYLMQSKTAPAGFVLVNTWSPSGQVTDFAIAEFFIAPNARKNGLGQQAAQEAFSTHPGQWELSVSNTNNVAKKFWLRVLAKTNATQIAHGSKTIFRFHI